MGAVAPADDDVILETIFLYICSGQDSLICIAACTFHLYIRVMLVPKRHLIRVYNDRIRKNASCYLRINSQCFACFGNACRSMSDLIIHSTGSGSYKLSDTNRIPT